MPTRWPAAKEPVSKLSRGRTAGLAAAFTVALLVTAGTLAEAVEAVFFRLAGVPFAPAPRLGAAVFLFAFAAELRAGRLAVLFLAKGSTPSLCAVVAGAEVRCAEPYLLSAFPAAV